MDRLEEKLLSSALKNHKGEDGDAYIQEALRQMRILLDYMKKKYPHADMEYSYFEPYVKTTEYGVLCGNLKGSGIIHKIIIRRVPKADICRDDVYGELIRKEYDQRLSGLLSAFIGPVKTFTVFFTLTSDEMNENNAMKLALEHHPAYGRHIDVFAENAFEVNDLLKFELAENGFWGAYTVYVIQEGWNGDGDVSKRYEKAKELMHFRIDEKDYGFMEAS